MNKCDHCGIVKVCNLSLEKQSQCMLPLGYKPVDILAITQLINLKKTKRSTANFKSGLDLRDIEAWNNMVLRRRGIEVPL